MCPVNVSPNPTPEMFIFFEKWVPIGCPHGYLIGYPLEGLKEPVKKEYARSEIYVGGVPHPGLSTPTVIFLFLLPARRAIIYEV